MLETRVDAGLGQLACELGVLMAEELPNPVAPTWGGRSAPAIST